jgi:hypothetical protein
MRCVGGCVAPRVDLDVMESRRTKRATSLSPSPDAKLPTCMNSIRTTAQSFRPLFCFEGQSHEPHERKALQTITYKMLEGRSHEVNRKINSVVAWVREWTIPTERPLLVGEVSANVCWYRMPCGQSYGSLRPYSRLSRPEPLLFLSNGSSVVLKRLCGSRSRPTTSQKICSAGNRNPDLWICSQEFWPLDHRGGLLIR